MLPTTLILAVLCVLGAAHPEADPADDILRSEIESAATESRALADELAAMLARLEAEEDREEAVEAAVVGDDIKVKEALTEMVDKIEELAEVSEDSNLETIAGTVENQRSKEEELRKTLEKLEIVATEIEEVASSADSVKDVDAIEKMAKLLQSVSDKVEEKTKDIDNEKNPKDFEKDNTSTSLELNGIDEMIRSLEKVTHDLRDLNAHNANGNTEQASNLTEETSTSKPRQQKSLSLDTNNLSTQDETINDDIESIRESKGLDIKNTEKDENELNSTNYKEKNLETKREPKKLEKLEEPQEDEECTDRDATNRVKVCLLKFSSTDSTIQLYSGEVREERHCFDVTKTICEESSQIVSKEVCVYSYNQKTVVAPAQMTEVTFERRQEKMGVTKCKKEKIKEAGYKEKEVEVCKQDYVEAPFSIPSVAENINEFIELSIPEPDRNCQTYRFEIPEVICKDVTTRECTELAYVDAVAVTEYLDTVQLDYKGMCDQKELKQQQKVCIQEEKKKKSRPSYRG